MKRSATFGAVLVPVHVSVRRLDECVDPPHLVRFKVC